MPGPAPVWLLDKNVVRKAIEGIGASLIAACYGTFGLDPTGLVLGVTVVVTFDRSFINNFEAHREALLRRLKAMTAQMRPPYHEAKLPEMAMPERILQK